MSTANAVATTTVTFPSQDALKQAVYPFTPEDVSNRTQITLKVDPTVFKSSKVVSLRGRHIEPLTHCLYQDATLSVYMPDTPFVPHHLAIRFNREVKQITDVTAEENKALYAMANKAREIYQKLDIASFALTQSERTGQFVAELIPHPPGYDQVKDTIYMLARNHYTHYPIANLSSPEFPQAKQSDIDFWKEALANPSEKMDEDTTQFHSFDRYESSQQEGVGLLKRHFLELMEDAGGKIDPPIGTSLIAWPGKVPQETTAIPVNRCPFCDNAVLERQGIFSYQGIQVMRNQRTYGEEGTSFLILPKRHNEKIYGLTDEEINNIHHVHQALITLLHEKHPDYDVVDYIQDGSSTGQTVFHHHIQVTVLPRKWGSLAWTLVSLSNMNVTTDELNKLKIEYGPRLEELLNEKEQPLAM